MGGSSGAPPDPSSKSKDPLVAQTDLLRLTAFNNMAAVYSKMGKWDEAKEKCTRVLKHDEKNTKALFRRGMAHRKLNLYELSRADLIKAKNILNNKSDAAIERELKLLEKDEKSADKAFYAKMKKQIKKAQKKKQEKAEKKRLAKEEEEKVDDNPNLMKNIKDNEDDDDEMYRWDIPEDSNDENSQNINDKS